MSGWRTIHPPPLGRELRVWDFDKRCFVGEEDVGDFWSVYERDEYEPGTTALIDRLVGPGKIFVDVGAWVGPFTLWAAARGARVVAFEPDPAAFERLCANVRENGLGDRVRAIRAALATSWTTEAALDRADGAGLSRLVPAAGGPRVACFGVESLVDVAGGLPSLVKLDVEGYEVELLPALGPWLAARNVALQASLHGEYPPESAFAGYPTVLLPESPSGDVVALPFLTMRPERYVSRPTATQV